MLQRIAQCMRSCTGRTYKQHCHVQQQPLSAHGLEVGRVQVFSHHNVFIWCSVMMSGHQHKRRSCLLPLLLSSASFAASFRCLHAAAPADTGSIPLGLTGIASAGCAYAQALLQEPQSDPLVSCGKAVFALLERLAAGFGATGDADHVKGLGHPSGRLGLEARERHLSPALVGADTAAGLAMRIRVPGMASSEGAHNKGDATEQASEQVCCSYSLLTPKSALSCLYTAVSTQDTSIRCHLFTLPGRQW
jgi:hypothetical protein